MKIKIEPPNDVIDHWLEIYVPVREFLFLKEEDLSLIADSLSRTLIIPKEEFFNHASYKQIQLVNSFEYWNLSNEVQYVVISNSEWFANLSRNVQKQINHIQFELNRGLILPLTPFCSNYSFPEEYLVQGQEEQYIVLHREIWRTLPYEIKENLLIEYASKWDDWTCVELPESAPPHLRVYANTFPLLSGGNCLSATLFAVNQQEWIIHEWVHPETFLEGLKRANYSIINTEELHHGDVVVWVNEGGMVQHASYHISHNVFFNKNGQTFFNPWRIMNWDELRQEWKAYKFEIYRKEETV
ncbi:hypothetical protein [Paenibacillus xylanilyticus]|uniref:hypothetical protein n=1 Tax=Paenibacillus xylanilyticus TaxID=248903 RepID=UPI00129E5B93|nr:hypothetical protein [Paenibacillus xylanilyticus]